METGNQKNKSGWAQIDGKWYSFCSWGGVRTGWFNYDGNKYYLHEDGHMEDNALNVNGTMYLFKSWGGMCVNDVGSYNGNYYYVGADGAVSTTTGWKKLNQHADNLVLGNCRRRKTADEFLAGLQWKQLLSESRWKNGF